MAHRQTEVFVANLKALCVEHGSIQQIADAAALSRVYVSRVVNGHAIPTIDVAARIAEAAGLQLSDMLKKNPKILAKAS